MSDTCRRTALRHLAAVPLVALGCSAGRAKAAVCAPTAPDIEGPFFKPGAPGRTALVGPRAPGRRLTLAGGVVGPDCRPIKDAVLELWQADHRGVYDLDGHRFRATVPLEAGRFEIATIVPGRYLNGSQYRPAHLHVKLRAPGFAPLTTQLYLPGDPHNAVDPWFKPELLVEIADPRADALEARFRFALAR